MSLILRKLFLLRAHKNGLYFHNKGTGIVYLQTNGIISSHCTATSQSCSSVIAGLCTFIFRRGPTRGLCVPPYPALQAHGRVSLRPPVPRIPHCRPGAIRRPSAGPGRPQRAALERRSVLGKLKQRRARAKRSPKCTSVWRISWSTPCHTPTGCCNAHSFLRQFVCPDAGQAVWDSIARVGDASRQPP